MSAELDALIREFQYYGTIPFIGESSYLRLKKVLASLTDGVVDPGLSDLGNNLQYYMAVALKYVNNKKPNPIPFGYGVGPLDQAVYVPTNGPRKAEIVGVRGGYLLGFDPDTGEPTLNRGTFRPVSFGGSSIAYDPVTDSLIVSCWNDQYDFDSGFFMTPSPGLRSLYKMNPATLGVVAFLDMATGLAQTDSFIHGGPHSIIAANSLIYGIWYNSQPTSYLFSYDPTSNTAQRWFNSNDGVSSRDLVWDSFANDGTVVTDGLRINAGPTKYLNADTGDGGTVLCNPSINTRGLCIVPSTGVFYSVGSVQTVVKFSTAAGNIGSFLLPDVTANPYKCRFNPNDGKIYVPGYASDKVYVVDPADDSIMAKTGFDSPFDMVFTPSKVFAVQHGLEGLKAV